MTDIIFSFDTEDFTSCRAADAILREAQVLTENGVVGCFCIVGHLADQLVSWNRTDVLEALSHHEIHNHSLAHSMHPTINEYTDIEDANEAISRVIEKETLANEKISAATGIKRFYAAVPPGNSKSYAAMYAYAKMGFPIYADTVCDTVRSEGVHYCNIFHTKYTVSFETLLIHNKNTDLDELLDKLSKMPRAIIYTHPNVATHTEWWDLLNYNGENKHPFGEWEKCKERPREEEEAFYSGIGKLVKKIKSDKRFRITTYTELAGELGREGKRIIKRSDVPKIKKMLDERFYPITEPLSASISDIMLAARDMLLGADTHECGFVYGFLETPYAIERETSLTSADIIAAARSIRDGEFLPSVIMANETQIGPADWLYAALDVILGKEELTLTPRPQLPSLDELPELRDNSFQNSWIHSKDFKDEYLSHRLRLQCYTMRLRSKAK